MSEIVSQITRKYLEMSVKVGEDQALEWLIMEHPDYVDNVLDYLDEFLLESQNYAKFN